MHLGICMQRCRFCHLQLFLDNHVAICSLTCLYLYTEYMYRGVNKDWRVSPIIATLVKRQQEKG